MTDTMGSYMGGGKFKKMTKKEIEKMKKIMRKVPLIEAQNDTYHSIEIKKADDEFDDKLNDL